VKKTILRNGYIESGSLVEKRRHECLLFDFAIKDDRTE